MLIWAIFSPRPSPPPFHAAWMSHECLSRLVLYFTPPALCLCSLNISRRAACICLGSFLPWPFTFTTLAISYSLDERWCLSGLFFSPHPLPTPPNQPRQAMCAHLGYFFYFTLAFTSTTITISVPVWAIFTSTFASMVGSTSPAIHSAFFSPCLVLLVLTYKNCIQCWHIFRLLYI